MNAIPETINAHADKLRFIADGFNNSNVVDTQTLREAADELERLTKKANALARIVRQLDLDSYPQMFFISGVLGQKDEITGMPGQVLVCPSYGVDVSYVYEKTDRVLSPEW